MSAAEALREADTQLQTARKAVEVARQRFLEAPSMKAEETVEDAERHVRRAERFREARVSAADRELAAQREELKAQARAKRATLLVQRGEGQQRVMARMREIMGVYTQLNEIVSDLDSLVQADIKGCNEANALAIQAGDAARLAPLNTEELRLTINATLASQWDDKPSGDVEIAAARKALDRLNSPGTASDLFRRLETVVTELDHAFGAVPLCRWLDTLRAPTWDDRSPAAERARHALKLAEQLKERQP